MTEEMIKEEETLNGLLNVQDTLKNKILRAHINIKYKTVIYEKFNQVQKMTDDSTTSASMMKAIMMISQKKYDG